MSAGDEPRKRRRLSGEERALWKTFTRSVRRLKPAAQAEPAEDATVPALAPAPSPKRTAVATAPAPQVAPSTPPAPAPLGRRLRQKIARGNEAIEGRLDLHGLTQQEAHHALARFLRSAQADGTKTVLVITGKGIRTGRDPFAERGVLRRLVPQWLGEAEFRDLVLGFETAHVGHGGEGALYVRLRRPRSTRA